MSSKLAPVLFALALSSSACSHLPLGLGGKSPASAGSTSSSSSSGDNERSTGDARPDVRSPAVNNDNPSGKPAMTPELLAHWEEADNGRRNGVSVGVAKILDSDDHNEIVRAAEMLAGVEAFDLACKKYQFPRYRTGVSSSTTETACAEAATWKAQVQPTFAKLSTKILTEQLDDARKSLSALSKEGWVYASSHARYAKPDAFHAYVQELFELPIKRFGLVLDAKLVADLDATVAGFPAAMTQAASVARLPTGLKADGYLKQKAHEEFDKTGDVVASGYSDGWSVSKNDLAIPEYKWTKYFILVRPKGATHCELHAGDLRKTYEGHGTYGTHFVQGMDRDYQISRCK